MQRCGAVGGEVVDMRLLYSKGSNHCFLEFAQEAAARRALDCSGALLGGSDTPILCFLFCIS